MKSDIEKAIARQFRRMILTGQLTLPPGDNLGTPQQPAPVPQPPANDTQMPTGSKTQDAMTRAKIDIFTRMTGNAGGA